MLKRQLNKFDADIVRKMKADAEELEYEAVKKSLKTLAKYSYKKNEQELLDSMVEACDSFGAERLDELISKL